MDSNLERNRNKDIHRIAENTNRIANALEYLVKNIQIMEAEDDSGYDTEADRDSDEQKHNGN